MVWLVVWTPLKNISQLAWLFQIYGKIKNVWSHQPVVMFHRYVSHYQRVPSGVAAGWSLSKNWLIKLLGQGIVQQMHMFSLKKNIDVVDIHPFSISKPWSFGDGQLFNHLPSSPVAKKGNKQAPLFSSTKKITVLGNVQYHSYMFNSENSF